MKKMIEKIIKECNDYGINVSTENRNGEIAYRVSGFSKSGSALLYVEDDVIICETRYGQKDHIITFIDLALIAKQWYNDYKDRTPFEKPELEWIPVFDKYFNINKGNSFGEDDDLPF